MDITVCGAIAPYGPILGGKLVSLLLAGPEAVHEYERRYKDAVSVIASSMAGKPIVRNPRLALLGTTSLYGTGVQPVQSIARSSGNAWRAGGNVFRGTRNWVTVLDSDHSIFRLVPSMKSRCCWHSGGKARCSTVFLARVIRSCGKYAAGWRPSAFPPMRSCGTATGGSSTVLLLRRTFETCYWGSRSAGFHSSLQRNQVLGRAPG